MRLEQLAIVSFGALADRQIEFSPGLNLIVGPNETGKSTLFQAIQNTLLTQSRLTKPQFQNTMQRFLPAGGGDTIAAGLRFSSRGAIYTLTRQWGKNPSAELVLPDGSRLGSEDNIALALKELLPAQEGTVRSVLMTYQGGLSRTLEDLQRDRQALHSLSDLLRKAVLETDGVSVGRFQELLEKQYADYFEHWDEEREQPEGKRGVDNPYKKGVGNILAAYYSYQKLRRLHDQVVEQEDHFSTINGELEQGLRDLEKMQRFVEGKKPAAQGARNRELFQAELKGLELEGRNLNRDLERRPVMLSNQERLTREHDDLAETIKTLDKEREQAEVYEQGRADRERLARLLKLKAVLETEEEALKKLKPLPREEFQELLVLSIKTEQLKAGLQAGRINLSLTAKNDLSLSAQADLQAAAERKIPAGETIRLKAEGRILLEHVDFSLELSSGQGNFRKKARMFTEAEEALLTKLAERGVASIDAAKTASEAYEDRKNRSAHARENLETELGKDDFRVLQDKAGSAAAAEPKRSLNGVMEELIKARSRDREIGRELDETETELGRLNGEYGSKEALLDRVVENRAGTNALQKKIAELSPLPEGFEDSSEFLKVYQQIKEEVETAQGAIRELEIACARMEENMPDESSEEVAGRLHEAEQHYRNTLNKGRAVARIRRTAETLLEELDRDTTEVYSGRLSAYIRETTGNRYKDIRLDEVLPQGLVRGDGSTLPCSLLSAGTQDSFALSLRLAMAEYFLADMEGFLILDDPLVDLDPERQKLAAGALTRFARSKQLILFTCHPRHADYFEEANRLDLVGL